ncbi:MAG: diguanylate cyclase [Gammaproteobacteria bacterium]|nr:diguanylate cyclase [Gammaproteobacteria bacterium]
MNKYKLTNRPLWIQLLVAMIFAMLIADIATSWSYRWLETEYLEQKITEKNRQVFLLLSAVTIEAIITEDTPMLETILSQATESLPNVQSITINNEDEMKLAQWQNPHLQFSFQTVRFLDNIIFEEEVFGTLEIIWDLTSHRAEIDQHMGDIRIIDSTIFFISTILILFLIHRLVVRHINLINDRILKLADGDVLSQISLSASDELMRLADSVNHLSHSLQLHEKQEEELRLHRDHLKNLVDEKTADLQKANNELEILATTDKLSQLMNRASIDDVFENEIARFWRTKSQFTIVLLDIDFFKQFNDNFGHQIGDKVIVEISRLLKNNVRSTDSVGRWGGEEFLIICPSTDSSGGRNLAESLREKIAQYKFVNLGKVTCSFGVTTTKTNDQMKDMLKRADTALYKAKDSGRNKIEYL